MIIMMLMKWMIMILIFLGQSLMPTTWAGGAAAAGAGAAAGAEEKSFRFF